MALAPYTVSEWCDIGAHLWDLVRQRGDTRVQITFINGHHMSDETLTVAPSSTDLRLIFGNVTKPWEDSSLTGRIANLRAFRVPNFEHQLILPIVGAARELGRVARNNHFWKGALEQEIRLCHRGRAESKHSASFACGRGAQQPIDTRS
ncbi:hypothetical protein TcBrA4_0132290 [Trypanosoma cruzi]|nr:hypothetical protein TcBrA4_0132290 [Trypanosoma cruzi]